VEIVRKALRSAPAPARGQRRHRRRDRRQEVKKGKGAYGYNVATGEYVDLIKDGVIDPAKVTRAALQNAASIAGLLLTTECMITEIPGRMLHRKEILKLRANVEQKGYTVVPLALYFKRGLAKVELGLCKGKALHDKREAVRRKTDEREAERAIRAR
jgi:hypothetical protein